MRSRLEAKSPFDRALIILGLGLVCLGLLLILHDVVRAPTSMHPALAAAPSTRTAAPGLDAALLAHTPEPEAGMLPINVPGAGEPGPPPAVAMDPVATLKAAGPAMGAVPNGQPPSPTPTATIPPETPVRLVIPDIGLDAPVVPVESQIERVDGVEYHQWQAPDEFAAGWHQTSARLGEIGNTVLNGHHNISGKVFARLSEVQVGDMIAVYGEGNVFLYQVANVMILPERDERLEVRLSNARWTMPTNDERLTLISCWPADNNTHRVVVVARPYR